MKVLLYFDIKKTNKKGLKLYFNNFSVSIHKNEDMAFLHAYKEHRLHRVVNDAKGVICELPHWASGFDHMFAVVIPYQRDISYSSDEKQYRKYVYNLIPRMTWENTTDQSIKLSELHPPTIVPKGWEIANDGIIEKGWQRYWSSTSIKESYFTEYFEDKYLGMDVAKLIKKTNNVWSSKDLEGNITDTMCREHWFIRPKNKK